MLARTCFIRYALFRQKGCTYVHHAFQLARGCIKNILFHNIYFSLYIQARSNFTKIYSKLHIYCRAQYRNFVSVAKKKLFLDFRLEVFFVFAWKTLKRRSIALLITIQLFPRASNLRGRFYRKFVTLISRAEVSSSSLGEGVAFEGVMFLPSWTRGGGLKREWRSCVNMSFAQVAYY